MRRRAIVATGLLALAPPALCALAWHYASLLNARALDAAAKREALARPKFENTAVRAASSDQVALSVTQPDREALRPGVWGLSWPGGYGTLTNILDVKGDIVLRQFRPDGDAIPGPGARAHVEGIAVPADGGTLIREHGALVQVRGPLGNLATRLIPGPRSTWAIIIHGNSLDWRDLARLAPALHGAGFPVMLATYRNAPGAPPDPSGRLAYGANEWPDLAAAVRYALESGARDVVLIGASMGAAVILGMFVNDPDAARAVRAVVFDAPVLSFRRAVDFQAARVRLPVVGVPLPRALTATARWFAARRFGVDWRATDHMCNGGAITAPLLIFHGDDDRGVPIETSREFARANPANVTLVEVPGVRHLDAWNADPAAYESRLLQFLEDALR